MAFCSNRYIGCILFIWIVLFPFNKPTIKNDLVFRLRYSDHKHELVTDGTFNVTSYQLRYIKKPQQVNIGLGIMTDLPDHLHEELVQEAINVALEDLQSQRTQTFPSINNTKE